MRIFLLILFSLSVARAQNEIRMYSYTNLPPEAVERSLRELVPIPQRVKMNPAVQQAMVVADAETHARIADTLQRLDQPVPRLKVWARVNREVLEFECLEGQVITLPVSTNPPEPVVSAARAALPPGKRQLPVQGSALEVQTLVLRRAPEGDTIRLRITPAVVFGKQVPYEPVKYPELATDVLMNSAEYADLSSHLNRLAFYETFLLTQPAPEHPPKPVSLLLSLETITPTHSPP